MEETIFLTVGEMEILAVIAINTLERGEFAPGVPMHPTLLDRLKSGHGKLVEALELYR